MVVLRFLSALHLPIKSNHENCVVTDPDPMHSANQTKSGRPLKTQETYRKID